MGWSAIILALIQLFGPAISAWLKEWLESRLRKAAATLGDPGEVPGDRVAALFDAAIRDLPRVALGRRNLLRGLKRSAVAAAARHPASPMTADELDEIRDLAAAADDE